MAIHVLALDRGGYAASGGCYYDPRPAAEGGRAIKLDVFEDEVIPVTVEFQAAPTQTDYEEDGVDISAPVISGNSVSFQIQGLNAGGMVSLVAMFADGAARRVNFIANENQPYASGAADPTDDDDVDDGAWG